MKLFGSWRRRFAALAAVVGLSLAAVELPNVLPIFDSGTPAGAQPRTDSEPPRAAEPPADLAVSEQEVAESNQEVRAAFDHLTVVWTEEFQGLGLRFATPRLLWYRRPLRTLCGVIQRNNAVYCGRDNTIYYDDVFVAVQAKRAALELGTDGDMTAVGVIAHEMGHAAAIQLGYGSRFSYDNEAVADCLAGAFARRAGEESALEPGDVEEAFYGMATAGDPDPLLTGDPVSDEQILRQHELTGHGTRDQRMANFRDGLEGGPGACLDVFPG